MRKKTIAVSMGVYLAICLGYAAVNGINLPAAENTENADTLIPIAETVLTVTTVSETTGTSTSTTTVQSFSANKRRSKSSANTVPSATETTENTKIQNKDDNYEQTTTSATVIQPTAQTPAVPTMEEYLSKLKCGGCGHGCSLLNPRCMRGARKQSSAQSDYTSLYG